MPLLNRTTNLDIEQRPRKDTKTASDNRHYPFELPSGWEWCTLDSLCSIKGGKRIPKGYTFASTKTNHIYLRVSDMKYNTIILDDLKYIDDEVFSQIKNYTINKSDLYLTIAGTIGSVGIIPEEVDGMSLTENAAKLTDILCVKEYLLYALQSTVAKDHFSFKYHQVAQPKLSIETASKTPIPLPPYQEQFRIVAEIKHWLSLIERIESTKKDLQIIVSKAKNKILDLAIHGKLVPQDSADEPASELLKRVNPSAEITCDNEQYGNMPNGWCVCRIKDLFKICMGQSPAGTSLNQIEGMEFHQGKICFTDKFLDKSKILTKRPTKIADANSLLICVRAPVGVLNINTRQICIGRGLCALLPSKCVDLDFAFHCLTTYQQRFEQKSTGSTFKAISGDIIKNELFQLPPHAEQQRIVAKIEELFAQLDAIENSLQA